MKILTDNANRAIQCNVPMQVSQPGGQLWNQCNVIQVLQPDDLIISLKHGCNALQWVDTHRKHFFAYYEGNLWTKQTLFIKY